MSAIDPDILVPLGLVALVTTPLAAVAARRLLRTRARARARRRVVEMPNSHYASPLVREAEARHRWHGMRLDRIHEINRAEVVRLLARAEAVGVDSLRPGERTFLDRMAEIAGVERTAEPRGSDAPHAADLQLRPA